MYFFFKDFIHLFESEQVSERERERERERAQARAEAEGEREAGSPLSREAHLRLDPRTLRS